MKLSIDPGIFALFPEAKVALVIVSGIDNRPRPDRPLEASLREAQAGAVARLGQGALEVAFVRSPYAHAVVRDVDVRAAVDAAGLHAIYTFDDLSGLFAEPLPVIAPHPGLVARKTQTALAGGEDEGVGLGDHPLFLQPVGDVLGIHAALDHHRADAGERAGPVELALGVIDPDGGDQQGEQEADQERAQGADHRTAAAAARIGHPR